MKYRHGDVVRVSTEAPMHGEVIKNSSDDGIRRGRIVIRTLVGRHVHEVRVDEVTRHWRLVR